MVNLRDVILMSGPYVTERHVMKEEEEEKKNGRTGHVMKL